MGARFAGLIFPGFSLVGQKALLVLCTYVDGFLDFRLLALVEAGIVRKRT